MQIKKAGQCWNQYAKLLLLGDESIDMIKTYIESCDIYLLCGNEVIGICAVQQGQNQIEIKNIAIREDMQHKGYGSMLLNGVLSLYRGKVKLALVGTGESPATLPFYKSLGFFYSHRIKVFFTNNYDHPIIECGVILKDMIYLKKYID